MSEPLPHYVNIAKKLRSYGIDARDEPAIFILGGNVVTAEINAKKALHSLAAVLEGVAREDGELDAFDAGRLGEATDAVAVYQRARRDLLRTAEELGIRRGVSTF